jgi:hypothetical protein
VGPCYHQSPIHFRSKAFFSLPFPLADSSMRSHSHHSTSHRRLMTSTPLSVMSTIPSSGREQVHNSKNRIIGSMCLWLHKPMCAPRMHPQLVANASSLDQVPSFSRTSVRFFFPFYPTYGEADVTRETS